MYEVNGWHKYGERNTFEEGGDPDNCVSFSGNERWSAVTVPGLLYQLRDFVGVPDDYEIELDACDEDGRVDISVMETGESYPANDHDIALWKKGERALWCSTYTFYVQKVERKGVRLLEEV